MQCRLKDVFFFFFNDNDFFPCTVDVGSRFSYFWTIEFSMQSGIFAVFLTQEHKQRLEVDVVPVDIDNYSHVYR
jgi:hypothetical protein